VNINPKTTRRILAILAAVVAALVVFHPGGVWRSHPSPDRTGDRDKAAMIYDRYGVHCPELPAFFLGKTD
jgi:hypothetical protein